MARRRTLTTEAGRTLITVRLHMTERTVGGMAWFDENENEAAERVFTCRNLQLGPVCQRGADDEAH